MYLLYWLLCHTTWPSRHHEHLTSSQSLLTLTLDALKHHPELLPINWLLPCYLIVPPRMLRTFIFQNSCKLFNVATLIPFCLIDFLVKFISRFHIQLKNRRVFKAQYGIGTSGGIDSHQLHGKLEICCCCFILCIFALSEMEQTRVLQQNSTQSTCIGVWMANVCK